MHVYSYEMIAPIEARRTVNEEDPESKAAEY
jgi:hypothetical protein